jgi:hypothetical protein
MTTRSATFAKSADHLEAIVEVPLGHLRFPPPINNHLRAQPSIILEFQNFLPHLCRSSLFSRLVAHGLSSASFRIAASTRCVFANRSTNSTRSLRSASSMSLSANATPGMGPKGTASRHPFVDPGKPGDTLTLVTWPDVPASDGPCATLLTRCSRAMSRITWSGTALTIASMADRGIDIPAVGSNR